MAAQPPPPRVNDRKTERGAILVQVAIAMIVLIAFLSFVADYGLMWVGRRQAQNSADAGALAGAIALAYDDFADRSDTGPAKVAARTTALQNFVAAEQPDIVMATDVTFVACPDDSSPPALSETPCIRVDVYRNQERNNQLPVWFSQLVGVVDQGVKATATARAGFGNATNCLKPWSIPDKWYDNYDEEPENAGNSPIEWADGDDFEPEQTPADVYVAPGELGDDDPGSGFTVAADEGKLITLKNGGPHDAISPGHFYPIVLPGTGTGGDEYRESIATCQGGTIETGDTITIEPGNMIGPTNQGVDDLFDADEDLGDSLGLGEAYWYVPPGGVAGDGYVSRVGYEDEDGNPLPASSPRTVCIALFDPDIYYASRMAGRQELTISNLVGFFILPQKGNDVMGYLTQCPGLDTGSSSLPGPSSFIPVIQLVR